MTLLRVRQGTAAQARGITIVIDVIRAFSVAGYAFAGGARSIWLVRGVDEAHALRENDPEALLAGEVQGRRIPGFQFNNSPAQMAQADVQGKRLIQRTGAGTQGAVNAQHASHILLCALTNARATAQYARKLAETTGEPITLFPTASYEQQGAQNEDEICADYVEALLHKQTDAQELLARGIAHLYNSQRFNGWRDNDPDFPTADIAAVLDIDRFQFAMEGHSRQWNDILYIEARHIDYSPIDDL
ncbi:MAG TPA: 2-phosphosulfolactate phosphatase [Ktedonobacteraceae bacterium]